MIEVFFISGTNLNLQAPNIPASVDLLESVTFRFRNCVNGESLVNGGCIRCPDGSFSLYFEGEATNCIPCAGIEGINSCHSNVINLDSGYWRRLDTSSTVMSCTLGSNACGG